MPLNRLSVNKLFCSAGIFTSDFVSHKLVYNLFKASIPAQTALFRELLPKIPVYQSLYFLKQFDCSWFFHGLKEQIKKFFRNLKKLLEICLLYRSLCCIVSCEVLKLVFCRLVLWSTIVIPAMGNTTQAATIKSSICVEACDELWDG